MQILKDEVKNKIIQSALAEFKEKGFEKASMRSIAEKANVTVGNVYRYFKSKEELFDSIIHPVFEKIIRLIHDNAPSIFHNNTQPLKDDKEFGRFIEYIPNSLVELYSQHKTELFILIDGSEGTKYEKGKEKIIQLIEEKIKNHLFPAVLRNGGKIEDPFIATVLARSNMEGIITIFRHPQDIKNLKRMLLQFQYFFYRHAVERLSRTTLTMSPEGED